MAHPQIAVFARLANGNAEKVRAIEGQATMLGRTMHGIGYDDVHDEIVVPQQFGQAILTFSGAATGDVAPLRVIRSAPESAPSLMIGNPGALTYDSKREEILVPN